MTSVSPEEIHEPVVPHVARTGLALSGLAALVIVFGDIGTSPLYTLKTAFDFLHGDPTPDRILGILSLLIWTLFMITTVKYVVVAMSIDNEGEGGILALMSLLGAQKHSRPLIVFAGLLGAALIYGDGAITPAISVLSALEGLNIAAPSFEQYVLPSAVVILAALFAVQPLGTARIGSAFGPIMAVWFVTIGLLGLWGIAKDPWVLLALNPLYGVRLLANNGYGGFLVLGGIFLCVTGAEALYADMGHFGKRPIRAAWSWIVFPCLVLNYAGQCAIALNGASISDNIFYRLCPEPLLIPLVGLATVATIIASQSIVTGAFSMTRQAIQLGWLPRLHLQQTSEQGYGQIYVGVVNWLLMIVTLGLTIGFGKSDNLASAYGIAVSATMLMTSVLLFIAMREIWNWPVWAAGAVAGLFIIIDGSFLAANLAKVLQGGWVPLLLASIVYGVMWIWHRGAIAVKDQVIAETTPLSTMIEQLHLGKIARVPGSAVFFTRAMDHTPPVMSWHVSKNRALHEYVLALTLTVLSVPWTDPEERLNLKRLDVNFWRAEARRGFMEHPDIQEILTECKAKGAEIDLDDVTYYVGHETVVPRENGRGMARWQELLFAA